MSNPVAAEGAPPASLVATLATRRIGLEAVIGQGGAGTVYRARDARHDRAVAVKVLRGSESGSPGDERFAREIAIIAGLRHPNILPLYDSGTADDGTRYYVMPLVEARSLRQRLAEGPLEVREAVRLACEIADALAAAHAAGVVHRDVKPENILLEAGHAVVADFGVAVQTRRTPAEASTSERLTAAGYVAGTLEYMSPEQAAGDRDLDGRSDTYSLGCVVYEMLAGHPPFTGSTGREVLAGRFRAAPPSLATLRPGVPPELSAAVDRALALDPADRYSTISEFAQALQDAVAAWPQAVRTLLPLAGGGVPPSVFWPSLPPSRAGQSSFARGCRARRNSTPAGWSSRCSTTRPETGRWIRSGIWRRSRSGTALRAPVSGSSPPPPRSPRCTTPERRATISTIPSDWDSWQRRPTPPRWCRARTIWRGTRSSFWWRSPIRAAASCFVPSVRCGSRPHSPTRPPTS